MATATASGPTRKECDAGAVKRQAARNAINAGSPAIDKALAPIKACSCITCYEIARGY